MFINRASVRSAILISLLIPTFVGCAGDGRDGPYGDVWLPAHDGFDRSDTGEDGSAGAECPEGFELLRVIERKQLNGLDVAHYCVEEC